MAKKKRKSRIDAKAGRPNLPAVRESQTSDAATIAWTVAVTMVVACDVAAIAAHLYMLNNPAAKSAGVFGNLMLLAGAIIGAGSLVLLPIVYRLRRVPPPSGFTVFAVCAAAAPILALMTRALL